MGNLHIEKNDSAIRSADPNRLDRYNLRLKWSESLYCVLAVGRVYQFKEKRSKEVDGTETRHAFISEHRGDFRETVNIENIDEHSTYIKALLKGEDIDGKNPKKIKKNG